VVIDGVRLIGVRGYPAPKVLGLLAITYTRCAGVSPSGIDRIGSSSSGAPDRRTLGR
jgi:hypothetical protein